MKKKFVMSLALALSLSMSVTLVDAKGAAVKNVKVNASGTKITVKWNKIKNASSYQIGYRRGKTWYSVYAGKKATSRTLYMSYPLTRYYLRMRVFQKGVAGPWSSVKSVKTGKYLSKVTGFKAKASTYSVKLSWKAVTNAKKYQIFYKRPTGRRYSKKTIKKRTSYTLSSLRSNSRYDVKMRALDGKGRYGAYSKRLTFTTKKAKVKTKTVNAKASQMGVTVLPDVAGISVAPGQNASINVSWTQNSGRNAYYVKFRKQGSTGNWYQQKSTGDNPTSMTIKSLEPSTTYELKVKRYNYDEKRRSSWSDTKTVTTYKLLDQAKISSIHVNGTRSMQINWNNVTDANKYDVVIKKGNDTIVNKAVTDLSYTQNDLDLGTNYTVTVKAYSDQYGEGATSEARTFTTMSQTKMNDLIAEFIDEHLQTNKVAPFNDDKLRSLSGDEQYIEKTVNIALRATKCSSTDQRSLYNNGSYYSFALKAQDQQDADIYNLVKQVEIEQFFRQSFNASRPTKDEQTFYESHITDIHTIINNVDSLKANTTFNKAVAHSLTDRSMVKAIEVMKDINTLRKASNVPELPTSYAMIANSVMNLGVIADESTASTLSHQYFINMTDEKKQCIARHSENPVDVWKKYTDTADQLNPPLINRALSTDINVMSVACSTDQKVTVFDASNDSKLGSLKENTVPVSEFEKAFHDYVSAHSSDFVQNY